MIHWQPLDLTKMVVEERIVQLLKDVMLDAFSYTFKRNSRNNKLTHEMYEQFAEQASVSMKFQIVSKCHNRRRREEKRRKSF